MADFRPAVWLHQFDIAPKKYRCPLCGSLVSWAQKGRVIEPVPGLKYGVELEQTASCLHCGAMGTSVVQYPFSNPITIEEALGMRAEAVQKMKP